jgi:hypothetical protein
MQYVASVAISIASDKAIRVLEEAARRSRDQSYSVSGLWLDRVGELETWKGNKLALTAFATAVLAKAAEPEVDPLSLIDRSGDPNSYNARMLARDVLVPSARRLGFLLGTDGPDPLAGSPWFGPERIDEIAKWRPKSKQAADNLVGWLASLAHEDAKSALVAFILRRSEVLQHRLEERKMLLRRVTLWFPWQNYRTPWTGSLTAIQKRGAGVWQRQRLHLQQPARTWWPVLLMTQARLTLTLWTMHLFSWSVLRSSNVLPPSRMP